jgi:hypothetical protein
MHKRFGWMVRVCLALILAGCSAAARADDGYPGGR